MIKLNFRLASRAGLKGKKWLAKPLSTTSKKNVTCYLDQWIFGRKFCCIRDMKTSSWVSRRIALACDHPITSSNVKIYCVSFANCRWKRKNSESFIIYLLIKIHLWYNESEHKTMHRLKRKDARYFFGLISSTEHLLSLCPDPDVKM